METLQKRKVGFYQYFDQLTWLRFAGLFASLIIILSTFPLVGTISYPVMAEFGILVYFYYSYQPHLGGLKAVATYGFLAWVSFGLLLYLPAVIFIKIVILAIVAAITMFISKRFLPNTAGPFFVIMIASLGGTVEMKTAMIMYNWIYLGIGILISFIAACGVEILSRFCLHAISTKSLPLAKSIETKILSTCYGSAIGIAYWVNLSFPFHSYNWLTVSAAANLKADNIWKAIIRYLWYVLGNIIGILVVVIISAFTPSEGLLLFITALFLMMVAIMIMINYALALALATPLAIILFDLLHGTMDDGLFIVRIVSIAIGSLIGLIADLIIIRIIKRFDITVT